MTKVTVSGELDIEFGAELSAEDELATLKGELAAKQKRYYALRLQAARYGVKAPRAEPVASFTNTNSLESKIQSNLT